MQKHIPRTFIVTATTISECCEDSGKSRTASINAFYVFLPLPETTYSRFGVMTINLARTYTLHIHMHKIRCKITKKNWYTQIFLCFLIKMIRFLLIYCRILHVSRKKSIHFIIALGIGRATVLCNNAELVNPCKARPT